MRLNILDLSNVFWSCSNGDSSHMLLSEEVFVRRDGLTNEFGVKNISRSTGRGCCCCCCCCRCCAFDSFFVGVCDGS